MSITDILIRSFSGYIFVVPGVLLYFLVLKRCERKQQPLHIAAVFVFCYYLIGILTMTGIGKLHAFSPRITLLPFVGMIRGPVDTLLNLILFFPMGLFLPLLYKKYNRIGRVALTGFLFSLVIELIQMFGRGATDINDLITNTLGAYFGYFAYKRLSALLPESFCSEFRANSLDGRLDVLFFMAYSLVIMVTIQPLVIRTLFRLG